MHFAQSVLLKSVMGMVEKVTPGKTSQYEKGTRFFIAKTDVGVINAGGLFTAFRIAHNIPFVASDYAGPLFRRMFTDSQIVLTKGNADDTLLK